MTDFEVRVQDNTNILIIKGENQIRMSVWMLGAHSSAAMTKEQAQQLIEALQAAIKEPA